MRTSLARLIAASCLGVVVTLAGCSIDRTTSVQPNEPRPSLSIEGPTTEPAATPAPSSTPLSGPAPTAGVTESPASEPATATAGLAPSSNPFRTAPDDPVPTFQAGLATLLDGQDADYGEPEVIRGTVSESGGGGWYSETDSGVEFLVNWIQLDSWRSSNGELVEAELSLSRPVHPDDGDYWRDAPTYGIVEFLVQMRPDRTRALVLEVRPSEPDAELIAIGDELRKPVVVETSLGELTLTRSVDVFYGTATWGSTPVNLSIGSVDDALEPGAIEIAELLWSDESRWTELTLDYATSELLELKNDYWLDGDERPLTDQEFRDRLTISSIDVGGDGRFNFWYDDGDLFYGHIINVSGTIEDGLYDAGING